MAQPILHFVHANSYPAGTYRVFFDHLKKHYDVQALAMHAHNPAYPVANGWSALAHELTDELIARYTVPVILVGHSMGGVLSLMVAKARPDLVRCVVLLDVPVVAGWRAVLLRVGKRLGLDNRFSPAQFSQKRRNVWADAQAAYEHYVVKSIFAAWPPEVLRDYLEHGLAPHAEGVTLRFMRATETAVYRTLPHHIGAMVRRSFPVPVGFIGGIDSIECRRAGLGATRRLVGRHLVQVPGGLCFRWSSLPLWPMRCTLWSSHCFLTKLFMHTFYPKTIAGLLLVITCGWTYADTSGGFVADYRKALKEGKLSHAIEIDNDTLLLNRNDGFYTSGLRYTQMYSLHGADSVTNFGWRIGQDLYTASDIKLPPQFVGPPNHPYAGWIYGGIFKELHRADGTYARYGIDIGCIGPCAGGEWTQTEFHRLVDQPLPQGWSKQVKNEFGAVLYAHIAPVRWTYGSAIDITPSVNARFGNIFTDAGAGVLIRAGQIKALPGQSTFHGFLRTDVRAVGYNATLQGGYFSKNNPHTVDPKRFVGEAEIGAAWIQGPYGAKVSVVHRGNEIRDLPDSIGAQNYVHLQFSYTP